MSDSRDPLEEALRARGAGFHRLAATTGEDAGDVRRRTARQQRTQRTVVAASVAVLVVTFGAVVGFGRTPGQSIDMVPADPSTQPALPTATATPGTAPPLSAATTVSPGPATTSVSTTHVTTTTTATPTTTATTKPGGVRAVDFANFTYAADTCDDYNVAASEIPLHNGQFQRPGDDGPVRFMTVSYGDLTSDGTDEALVTIQCNHGNHGNQFAWLFTADTTATTGVRRITMLTADPKIGQAEGAEPNVLIDATITGGTVVSHMTLFKPGDAMCCLSLQATVTQRWTGSAWVLLNSKVEPLT